jgi:hypothetical protein
LKIFWLFGTGQPTSIQNYCQNFKFLSAFVDDLWMSKTDSQALHCTKGIYYTILLDWPVSIRILQADVSVPCLEVQYGYILC